MLIFVLLSFAKHYLLYNSTKTVIIMPVACIIFTKWKKKSAYSYTCLCWLLYRSVGVWVWEGGLTGLQPNSHSHCEKPDYLIEDKWDGRQFNKDFRSLRWWQYQNWQGRNRISFYTTEDYTIFYLPENAWRCKFYKFLFIKSKFFKRLFLNHFV